MGSQGYEIKQNILFQDKQSSMKTKNLGKKLYTGKSKHIDIHYLFSKYRVESNKMSICILQHRAQACIFLHEIPTESPISEML